MTAPGLLADLVVVVHLGFIVFAIFGALLVHRWKRAAWLHLPALAWAIWIELSGGICPLTPLENALRRDAGSTSYGDSFVEHYIVPILYPTGLTPNIQIALAAGLLILNALLYLLLLKRRGSADRSSD
jgi:hypothetical protein